MKYLPRSILLAALAPAAYSQSVLYTFNADTPADFFGQSVSGAGDVNGDGFADLIVGAHRDDNNGHWSGSARVLSGVDGSILYSFDGDSVSDHFGGSVSGAGDVNGDGYDDMIVGAWVGNYARVFSGVDGSVLYTFHGNSSGDNFGWSVSGAGDLNGDGFDDLIVGAPWDDNHGQNSGSARVISGRDGSMFYTLFGDTSEDHFGGSVSGAGDVNGDGFDDLIVGASSADVNVKGSGMARVFSGNGSILYTFGGNAQGVEFGFSVSGAGDVNGDGFADLIVGAHRDSNNGFRSGSARVSSGVDGSILYSFDGDSAYDLFGFSVSGAGDVNGDGYDDLIVGIAGDDNNGGFAGSARVLSGVDGSTLYAVEGDSVLKNLGFAVSGAGDVNGDGLDDLLIGMIRDNQDGTYSGSASVFSGCDELGAIYCTPAVPNSSGKSALIAACGSILADGGYFMLHATDTALDKFGYFLTSQTQAFIPNPAGSQGNLCLGGQIGRFAKQIQNSGPIGMFTIRVDLTSMPPNPPHTVLAGETWNFQCWFRDANPGPTSNFTDAVSVLFQ